MAVRTYAVFISYRHADNRDVGRQWATWLHHSLETYEIPPELVGTRNQRGEPVPASLFPVFRDEEELPADADLSLNIRRALEHSGTLVVLCSPRAVASNFVDEEIRYFKELGKGDRILALLIDGEPNASDEALECLPRSLRFGKPRTDGTIDWSAPTQPIAADARPGGAPTPGWTTAAAYEDALDAAGALSRRQIRDLVLEYEKRLELAKLKVIAGALGLPLGELTRRNQAFALAKARRRARVLASWLAAVVVLAIAAAAAGVVALRNQREAERQAVVAEEQRKQATRERDRAVRESYVNVVRQAAAQVAAGQLAAGRQTLFKAPRDSRAWEWWYLIARCGPEPMPLSSFAALDPSEASALKSRLDTIDAASDSGGSEPPPQSAHGIVLRHEPYTGSPGAMWEARRETGGSILLNAFVSGMYGSVPAAILTERGLVCWRNGEDDATGRKRPEMASGEQLRSQTDYVASLRERYIVGAIGDAVETARAAGVLDRSTWADLPIEEPMRIAADPGRNSAVLIIGRPDSPVHVFDFETSTLGLTATPRDLWDDLGGVPGPPRAAALTATLARQEKQTLPPNDRTDYRIRSERGPAGPLVLSTWRFGNVRLRDGNSGRIIGESIAPPTDPELLAYGGGAAIVPNTKLVAGAFWWGGEIVMGVVDLEQKRVLARFENAPDMSLDYSVWAVGHIQVSPDGSEAAYRMDSRHEDYFAVWNVKSGKLVYGPAATRTEYEEPGSGPSIPLPLAYAWHPDGRFVAISLPSGVTELRRDFATAPFATLEGIDPSGDFRVQEIGEKNRVLVGNGVVDTTRWETLLTLPVGNFVSRDGARAVLNTRPGVIEVVRPGFRQTPSGVGDSMLLQQIRDADARDQGT